MNPRAHLPSPDDDLERLSALIDGECEAPEAAGFTRRWPADDRLQARWHAYHLIGDALRSDDLCRPVQREPFLHQLRERLAAEPVVLAPTPLPARATPRRGRWIRPVSAAAGVMAVAGSVWLLPVRSTWQGTPAPLAQSNSSAPPVSQTAGASVTNQAVRGARLDRYLAAHQEFQSAAAIAPVSGYLRHADYETAGR